MYVLLWRTVYALTRLLFCVFFPRCRVTREINTKITLSWAHKQFATRVHTLFYISSTCCVLLALQQTHPVGWKAPLLELLARGRFLISIILDFEKKSNTSRLVSQIALCFACQQHLFRYSQSSHERNVVDNSFITSYQEHSRCIYNILIHRHPVQCSQTLLPKHHLSDSNGYPIR